MLNCRQVDSEMVEVALLFKRKHLLYDIRNVGFVEGDIMTDEQYHQRHVVQDVGEEGNVDRVTRILDLAHSECVEMLYPFTQREIDTDVLDDRLMDKEVYGIIMNVPTTFSQTTLRTLEYLVHEYMMCRVMADWLSITNTPKAAVWEAKLEELKTAIRNKARMRRGRLRISKHLF